MKVYAFIDMQWGFDPSPTYAVTLHSFLKEIDVDVFNAEACIRALAAQHGGYNTAREITELIKYITNSGHVSVDYVKPGRWEKSQTDIRVENHFTPDDRLITDSKGPQKMTRMRGREPKGIYGIEKINFVALPETMKEIVNLSKQDAEAILTL